MYEIPGFNMQSIFLQRSSNKKVDKKVYFHVYQIYFALHLLELKFFSTFLEHHIGSMNKIRLHVIIVNITVKYFIPISE